MPSDMKPPLLAILICERIFMDQDRVPTLLRVIDTFNFRLEAPGFVDKALEQIAMSLNCAVFTKWGLGEGDFTQELAVVLPNGQELPDRAKVSFKKPAGFHFQQVRHNVSIAVKDSGEYKFRVYLDGQLAGEHPFRVNIERKAAPST